ncbi:MAG: DUF1643 domain-containing protein [Paracoccaceae bacterium]
MIRRDHQNEQSTSTALYSDCERYRYLLSRTWNAEGQRALFVMLNPSTATELQNDPTVERCERRARTLGFGAFRVANIFAWRATDPRQMRTAPDPVGPDNDRLIAKSARWSDQIICAWGTHGGFMDRGVFVLELLRQSETALFHLGLTNAGHPRHPLYIAYAQRPEPWPDQPADG